MRTILNARPPLRSARLLLLVAALVGAGAVGMAQIVAPVGSIFDPSDATSLGALNPVSSVVFNTTTGTVSIDGGGTLVGQTATSASGNVQLMAYGFTSINLGSGVTVTVTGDRGLALLSTGGIDVNTVIDVSGNPGIPTSANPQTVPGAEGGSGGSGNMGFNAPPPSDGGDGGFGVRGASAGDSVGDGVGIGAGGGATHGSHDRGAGGGGGSYGGAGGAGSVSGPAGTPGAAGPVYGDPDLADLFGGSGGGGSTRNNSLSASGGGGGGALALIAIEDLLLGPDAQLLAKGGIGSSGGSGNAGGGGSGGGILLATGGDLLLDLSSVIDASGGSSVRDRGGAGGGGRVALYSMNDLSGTLAQIDVSGRLAWR